MLLANMKKAVLLNEIKQYKNKNLFVMTGLCFMLMISLSACWAPRCPLSTCHSKYEHKHSDVVSGVFNSRYGLPNKLHFFWDKDKGESNPNTDFEADGKAKTKVKVKKKYPWESW